MKLLFGTGNQAKLSAMRSRLEKIGIELIGLSDLKAEGKIIPEVEENGETPLENARLKALAYYEAFHMPVFSCDSGLYFDNVPDEIQPGVHVRNVNGKCLSDEEMKEYYAGLVRQYGKLVARYRNAVCLVVDEEHIYESMDESVASEKFILTDIPHSSIRRAGFPLDCMSIDMKTGKYYYDLSDDELEQFAVEDGFLMFFDNIQRKFYKKPKMILFDYGQTLVYEKSFDGVKGTETVLEYAIKNKYNKSAEEIQEYANKLNRELGRFDLDKSHLYQIEIPNNMFSKYLYESQGIELELSPEEIDNVFWNAAAPGVPTEGIKEFLDFCKKNNIRTGVISNISYCGKAVEKRINDCIPENEFEFIIATSEYMYRKPNRRIFELALEKAGLRPEDVWYVGDNYQCDIAGARDTGIFPVWYIGAKDMKNEQKYNALTIKAWTELMELLCDID